MTLKGKCPAKTSSAQRLWSPNRPFWNDHVPSRWAPAAVSSFGPPGSPCAGHGGGYGPRGSTRGVSAGCPAAGGLCYLPTGKNLGEQGLELGLFSVSHLRGLILESGSPAGLIHSTSCTPGPTQRVWAGPREPAFLTRSQVMLRATGSMYHTCGTYLELI